MTYDLPTRLLTLLVFVCTCRTVVVVNGIQHFLETPVLYQEVPPEQDVLLPCRVNNRRGACGWQKDGALVVQDTEKYIWSNDPGKDCTLLIKKASLDYDDAMWVCQVSSTNFRYKDALSSLPSKLVVLGENLI